VKPKMPKNLSMKLNVEFINEVKRRFIQDNGRDKNDDILRVLKDYKTPVLLRVNSILPCNIRHF